MLLYLLCKKQSRVDNLHKFPASLQANKNATLYTAARSAVNSMVKTLAKELGEISISVSAIAPNFYVSDDTYSQEWFDNSEDFRAFVQKSVPLQRSSKAPEIEVLITDLASLESAFTTGKL